MTWPSVSCIFRHSRVPSAKLIERARLLSYKDETRIEAQRFSIAFPLQYGFG